MPAVVLIEFIKLVGSLVCFFVIFAAFGVLGQVWYLIASTPDISPLPYFEERNVMQDL